LIDAEKAVKKISNFKTLWAVSLGSFLVKEELIDIFNYSFHFK